SQPFLLSFAVHDGKKKQLLPSSGIKYSPEVLIIHCKNFRIIKFYFENTDQNESRKVLQGLTFSVNIQLGPFSNNSGTTLFESPEDWEFEMTRAKAIGWRVTRVNEAFKISKRITVPVKTSCYLPSNSWTVVHYFAEIDCRDMCCVVASLVQVLLDAQSRTIVGFQSLIQKEWVLAGHRFLDRLNHLQLDVGEVPVFQLFLDCMWQLLQQNPETFEFGETYLTVLSDSTRIPLFGTFLFNSQYQRDTESLESKAERYIRTDYKSARLPSVWDWSLQFGPEAQWLLRNPQFVQEKPTRKNSSSPMALLQSLRKGVLGEDGDAFRKGSLRHLRTPRHSYSSEELRMVATPPGLLSPCLASPLLRLWEQCYLRWLPQIPILGGGSVVAKQRLACLRQEIEVLHARLNTLQDMATPTESSLDQHLSNRCPLELSLQPSSEYSPGTPDSLFSTFPFVPTGILSHRTVPITPLSRLLFGRSASGEALAVDDYNGRI
uniref:Myotubularin related protein 10 n=1 Tax=Eptatretus burgeri TaxID=7764 RepID=A0A8C4X1F5_EPTBU